MGLAGLFLGFLWPLFVIWTFFVGCDEYSFHVMLALMAVGIAIAIILEIMNAVTCSKNNRTIVAESMRRGDEARQRAEAINSQNKEEAALVEEYRHLQAVPLQTEMDALEITRSALGHRRDSLYAKEYLHSSYRGLAPVTAILNYIDTGRCTLLYGHGGAIDTLVHDSQFNLLVGKLDTIIDSIDMINGSLSYLSQEMRACRDEITAMTSGINSMRNDLKNGIQRPVLEEMVKLKEELRSSGKTIDRIKDCEEYRAQCEAYLVGQRQYLPNRFA